MQTFAFTVVLDGVTEITDEVEDRLYERCNDATLWSRNGLVRLDFDREAESRDAAFSSAKADVEAAGYRVLYVYIDEIDAWPKGSE